MTNKSVITFLFFLVGAWFSPVTAKEIDMSKEPVPGKQTARKAELPVNTSIWKYGDPDSVRALSSSGSIDETQKEFLKYWLFLPKNYDPKAETEYPLVLFLHGAGERGDNVDKVKVHGPPKLLDKAEYQEKCPFIVVSPQCPDERHWSAKQLLLLIDEIEKEYKVDKSRIYVTGLSMGGFGTFALALESPKRFAAVAPICGGGILPEAAKLVDLPCWVFHGEKDSVVSVRLSKDMVESIKNSGGKKVKLTLYPNVDHDSWTETYNNEDLYKWFLENKRELK
ncbi:MAG: prolyl oligopeptidase family serine peptidase [Thermoguttaceae bacterium]